MKQSEKIESLKHAIEQLFVKEGKSRVYISNLLGLNRKELGLKITEWGFTYEGARRLKPSTQKFLNAHKQEIISLFNNDTNMTDIAKAYGMTIDQLSYICRFDEDIKKSLDEKTRRMHEKAQKKLSEAIKCSQYTFLPDETENEQWGEIIGFSRYQVSNLGRIRAYSTTYKKYFLISQTPNIMSNRLYVGLVSDSGLKKNLQVSRLVGHAFCKGYEDGLTINHKDGNVQNNSADNLEWVSQSQNNKHSYDILRRKTNHGKPIVYRIVYKDKYEFKTVAAFAKFIGKSETQARRWINDAQNHEIRLEEK